MLVLSRRTLIHSLRWLVVLLVAIAALPVTLLAQADPFLPDSSQLTPLGGLVLMAVPFLGSFVATFVMDGLKTYSNWVDRQSAAIQKLISGIVGILVGFGLAKIGMAATSSDTSSWTPEIVLSILTTLGQAGVFRMFKRQAAAAAGGVADASVSVNGS